MWQHCKEGARFCFPAKRVHLPPHNSSGFWTPSLNKRVNRLPGCSRNFILDLWKHPHNRKCCQIGLRLDMPPFPAERASEARPGRSCCSLPRWLLLLGCDVCVCLASEQLFYDWLREMVPPPVALGEVQKLQWKCRSALGGWFWDATAVSPNYVRGLSDLQEATVAGP